jgi:UDP-N-acetylenolpyruvoylglucosamine reductase
MKYYEVSETEVKVPGWLIEQAGFKGKRYGDAEFTKPSFSISELWQRSKDKILAVSRNIQDTIFNTLVFTLKPR